MDFADDIAYSTYDLEDAFKAEFLCPLGMLVNKPDFLDKLAGKVSEKLKDPTINASEISKILYNTYSEIFNDDIIDELIHSVKGEGIEIHKKLLQLAISGGATDAFEFSNSICTNGYLRTNHTSSLVHRFMSNVKVKLDKKNPSLSILKINPDVRREVQVLKTYTYETVIQSSRLKVAEFRGYDIVKEIFETLTNNVRKGYNLLPEDFRYLYDGFRDIALKNRVICDFIAGMTDRYAVEFFARLKSENPQTIFKPI